MNKTSSKKKYTSEDFNNEEWLTPKDIENKLNMSHATVSKLIHTKGFPMVQIGRSIKINAGDCIEYLKSHYGHTINI